MSVDKLKFVVQIMFIMARFRNPLDHVQVAAPCPADWDQMVGNERVKFCGQCSLNVYNLSSMTKAQAEHLISSIEGRLCVRFYRRRDGSIITKDCPVGLRAIARRVSYLAKAVISLVLGLFAGLGVHQAFSTIAAFSPGRTMGVMVRDDYRPVEPLQGTLVAEPPPTVGRLVVKKPAHLYSNSR
jgi:hypothetical protein